MDQSTRTVVLGLTVTSALQFVELNSRYSNESPRDRCAPLPYRRSFALSISILRAFIACSPRPSLPTPGVILPRIAVVIGNEVGLIEWASYTPNEEGVPARDPLCSFYDYLCWIGITVGEGAKKTNSPFLITASRFRKTRRNRKSPEVRWGRVSNEFSTLEISRSPTIVIAREQSRYLENRSVSSVFSSGNLRVIQFFADFCLPSFLKMVLPAGVKVVDGVKGEGLYRRERPGKRARD